MHRLRRSFRRPRNLLILSFLVVWSSFAPSQTASTSAIIGTAIDPSGAVVEGAAVHLYDSRTRTEASVTSDHEGRFAFLLISPGTYQLRSKTAGSNPLVASGTVTLGVTEVLHIELRYRLAPVFHQVDVTAESAVVQTESSSLGHVVNETAVRELPLVTRNFAQITGLSPGVTVGVFNAGELGVGGIANSQTAKSNDGIYVHGARSYDNNWQLDGVSVSDVQGSGSSSGGIPIPSPSTIQEFKVQTALYDATYGRYAGANIAVLTKTGSDNYHGSIFEYFRNDVLNANDFFLNRTGQPRPVLKQNQFGATLGGPIKKDKLFFFASYQGTRQVNGLASGQSRIGCAGSLSEPPLTNERTPAALGRLFGGMKGELGGVAVNPDGSNINPAALALLNFKLPDGSFLIPTPQTIDPSKTFAAQGFSAFTQPCSFDEDQFETNVDLLLSQKNKMTARFFFADDQQNVTFPGNFFNPVSNIMGFSSPSEPGFRVVSMADTYTFSAKALNEVRLGYVRTSNHTVSTSPFKWSDVGVAEGEMNNNNGAPNLTILGSVQLASAFPRTFAQNSFPISDTLTLVRGPHTLRLGGSYTRLEDNFGAIGNGSFVEFLSWPDFLLGMNAASNGTGTFSNVYASIDDFGLFDRKYRVNEGSAFMQDNYQISRGLTLSLGLRYERLGQFADNLGRNSSFDVSNANPNPSAAGSVQGYIVASNYSGELPAGVIRVNNNFGNYGDGQNTFSPRVGFAWQLLPNASQLVLRGGYGIYYSRPTGQAFFQSADGPPYSLLRLSVGSANADATFQAPFAQPFPTPESFPLFPAYSSTNPVSINTVAPNFRPSSIQQYSLNLQIEPYAGWLFEAGYVGTRGMHLQRVRSLNQALSASANDPVRGITANTVANIPLRVPIIGIPADSLYTVESEGSSWYNGLELSLAKHLSHGIQFLASYTFSKTLDTDGADTNATSAGTALTLGDQNSPAQRWGRASFDRPHRFVLSATWALPEPPHGMGRAIFGNWSLAAIATIQSGTAMTIADTNSTNVFGISEDRAQLSGKCSVGQLVTGGSVESKLNNYFNTACFTTPPIIGADGIGAGFGDSATGIVDGPGQANLDLSLSKTVALSWPVEKSNLGFRAEFFNALNHPQFANPDSNFSSPTFGVISQTAVNPRVGQLALTYAF